MSDSPVSPVSNDLYDLTIIGGGPTGLYAAFYAGLRHMKTKIIDSLDELGGQLATLYPEKYIYDVAGFPQVLARDLAKGLVEQASQYNPTICLRETVSTLEQHADGTGFTIGTNKQQHHSKLLLIAAGAGAFSPKKLTVPNADALEGNGVYYSVKSKEVFRNKRTLIIGGGDSAFDWALNLRDTASHISLIHRSDRFRAHEDTVKKVTAAGTQILTFFEIKAIELMDGKLAAAVVFDNRTKEERTLPVDAILMQIGFSSSLGPIKNWPLHIKGGSIPVSMHMETSVPGIYCAGDVAQYEGKLKLIATGFGEAAIAVNFAKTKIDPTAKLFPGHSSEKSA